MTPLWEGDNGSWKPSAVSGRSLARHGAELTAGIPATAEHDHPPHVGNATEDASQWETVLPNAFSTAAHISGNVPALPVQRLQGFPA
jgi:hypothetical protein